MERVRLLLAAIGDEPSTALTVHESLPASGAQRTASLWIISDVVAEASSKTFLESSLAAMADGHERWYFVPRGGIEEFGRDLIDSIERRSGSDPLRDRFRVYSAPSSLCSLRIEIRNPTEFGAESATVAGEHGKRIRLNLEATVSLSRELRRIIRKIDEGVPEHQGFKQVYPVAL